jgi:GNAT superfamily N-acetyltransferase
MTTQTQLDLTAFERAAIASRELHPTTLTQTMLDACGGWACDRLGLPCSCAATQATPLVDFTATSLVGVEHHHVCWMLTLMADPTIAHYEPLPVPASDPQAAEILASFIERRIQSPHPTAQGWIVTEAGRRVGLCQLRRTGEGHVVGVSLQADARNRGLGSALFKALAGWGLTDGEYVAGEVEDDNLISHAAIATAGYESCDRYPVVLADGRPTMVTRYEHI